MKDRQTLAQIYRLVSWREWKSSWKKRKADIVLSNTAIPQQHLQAGLSAFYNQVKVGHV